MKEERPILDLPKTQWESILDSLAFAGLFLGFVSLFFYYGGLPERIPIHYNGAGEVDGYGSKIILIVLLGIALAMALGMGYLTRFPHKFNYPTRITPENAREQYMNGRFLIRFLNTSIVWIFAYIIWRTIQIAKGEATGLSAWFMPLVLICTVAVPVYIAFRSAKKR